MSTTIIDSTETDSPAGSHEPAPPTGVYDPVADGWKRDKKGRWITGARGRAGTIYRQGDETVAEAVARDQEAQENGRPPKTRAKPKTPRPPAPTRKTDKELEAALTESLQAPAMLAAMHGDTWVAEHVYREAPNLSRNLIAAAEHNPKLRARLEQIAGGETALGQIVMQLAIGNALIAYMVPPIIYYLGARAPARLKTAFQVPEKPMRRPTVTPEHAGDGIPPDRAQPEGPDGATDGFGSVISGS